MIIYSNVEPCAVAEPHALYLITEMDTLRDEIAEMLGLRFELKQITPPEVLHLSAGECEVTIDEAEAVLIDWSEHGTAALLALKEAAYRQAVPLVALCSPNEAEQVAALVVGADATLVRPLKPALLQAQLMAYRRLAASKTMPAGPPADRVPEAPRPAPEAPLPDAHAVHHVGPLSLDHTTRQCFVYGQRLPLTTKEFDLVAYLMDHVGVCVTRDDVLNHVWNVDFDTGTNLLDARIYTLRRKLKTHGLAHLIETIRGIGYRFVDPRGHEGPSA